jgi:hypothetical protein
MNKHDKQERSEYGTKKQRQEVSKDLQDFSKKLKDFPVDKDKSRNYIRQRNKIDDDFKKQCIECSLKDNGCYKFDEECKNDYLFEKLYTQSKQLESVRVFIHKHLGYVLKNTNSYKHINYVRMQINNILNGKPIESIEKYFRI